MWYITFAQTGGNAFMSYGLKYLWGMVNLFQFLIIMKDWKINIPGEAIIVLE